MAPCFMADADANLLRLEEPPEATADAIFLVSHEIARQRPISHGQLGGIGGVGAGKLERYGDAVLETVLDAD